MTKKPSYTYEATPTIMPSIVRNTINGYDMGPMRALAQEPVQNSKDAALTKNTKVCVEFELHNRLLESGRNLSMLTITDSGTTGLGGAILTKEQLAEFGDLMPQGHDWNAFEGHGYTKLDEDALGSRGQGKSALLFASAPPSGGTTGQRMFIVYDTLLPDGEYRLGVRYAKPTDTTRVPPHLNDEARSLVQSPRFEVDDELDFPIRLNPLHRPGSRMIIPFLSDDAKQAIISGEFAKWLQLLWWRLIQLERLEIRVKHADQVHVVQVPDWWQEEPWIGDYDPSQVFVAENIAIQNSPDFKIKRVVLRCDESIPEYSPIIDGKHPEFDGVQLLRAGQWIETLGKTESWFPGLVTEDVRRRFRGFVEFDQKLDRELRKEAYETPQHDDFIRTTNLVKGIIEQVSRAVEEFSHRAGWTARNDGTIETNERDRDVARKVIATFTQPLPTAGSRGGSGTNGGTKLTVRLDADYPLEDSTRVDYGERLRNVQARCTSGPEPTFGSIGFELNMVSPDQETVPLSRTVTEFDANGTVVTQFKDVRIIQGNPGSGNGHTDAKCESSGRYRMQLVARPANSPASSISRSVYVEVDPPAPPPKSITLEVTAKNADEPERDRINSGEYLHVGISIRNRDLADQELTIDASVIATEIPAHLMGRIDIPRSLVLLANKPVNVGGIGRAGQPSILRSVFSGKVMLCDDDPKSPPPGDYITLETGKHVVQVDARDTNGEIVASVGRTFWFDTDPPNRTSGGEPFTLEARDDNFDTSHEAIPAWRLGEPGADQQRRLFYAVNHPLYRAAAESDQRFPRKKPVTTAYLAEISTDALLSWMLDPVIECGDEERFQQIYANRQVDGRWANLADRAEELCGKYRSLDHGSIEDALIHRRIVLAYMVRLVGIEGA